MALFSDHGSGNNQENSQDNTNKRRGCAKNKLILVLFPAELGIDTEQAGGSHYGTGQAEKVADQLKHVSAHLSHLLGRDLQVNAKRKKKVGDTQGGCREERLEESAAHQIHVPISLAILFLNTERWLHYINT